MGVYKVTFLDGNNYPIEHVIVYANSDKEAFDKAKQEYEYKQWNFKYYLLAEEKI